MGMEARTGRIKKAAVIGAGVMGSGIAAHLANVGIDCYLLDIVPDRLRPEEMAQGWRLDDPRVRSRLAREAIARMKNTKPSPLYDVDFAERIVPGNLEDHLGVLRDVDWIVEAVAEDLAIKRNVWKKIERVWRPGTIVSTNTSGISINEIAADRGEEFKRHFLGTHFFNPPRYMKLLEIIPGEKTDPLIVQTMSEFAEKTLGKGVVRAKDTPNFIANRIGTYGLLAALREMVEKGYTVDEVDAVSGPVLGRPKSATFRTLDLVGLDTFLHVAGNVYHRASSEAEKQAFAVPPFLKEMVSRGWLGEKSGQGFYKRVTTDEGEEILTLDIRTLAYGPRQKVNAPSLEAAKRAGQPEAKIRALLAAGDRYSALAWHLLKEVLLYAAQKLGEVADSIVEIDRAMKWGFHWELGPFETWDAIGLAPSVKRMEKEGVSVPPWVKEWIAAGHDRFYKQESGKTFYCLQNGYRALQTAPEQISLAALKGQNKTVFSNHGASLIDLGDGVACLEFHTKSNAIGADILLMLEKSMEEVGKNFKGLVIANEGRNFSVGANLVQLLVEAQNEEWDEIEEMIRQFQTTLLRLKYFAKPVVAAPHARTLGGGVEVCLAADEVYAAAETYLGLVETGVGLIPGAGGCKEMAVRAHETLANDPEADLQPLINKAFATIALAKVSTSAHEAKKLGLLRGSDRIVVNRDHLVYRAKQAVLRLDEEGYVPRREKKVRVVGESGKAVLQLAAYHMRQGNYMTDYDRHIAGKLAHVLAGGNVPAGALVSEQYLLDLEREAFLSLCGEEKTQERIRHMLEKGKPLRN
ncbi:3-hydroxyacyl-CoA dehydrogenase/enoyl-CoA hydratase family protein [Bacillaceae bacterium]